MVVVVRAQGRGGGGGYCTRKATIRVYVAERGRGGRGDASSLRLR